MRTTITLSDEMLREARIAAAQSGRTLSQVVQEALEEHLKGHLERVGSGAPFLPVSSAAGGLRPGVRFEPKHELWALLEDGEPDADPRR